MRIVAYIHPGRVGPNPTGVGKHIGNIVAGLLTTPDVDLSLLADKKDWEKFRTDVPKSPLVGCPTSTIGLRRAWIEKLWSLAGAPAAERWTGPVDWVYCPMEAYVPTRKARLAVTVHCMNWFEKFLPWYPTVRRERRAWRLKLGKLWRNSDALILTVSEYLKGRLVELFGISSARVAVVGNGVEPAYFEASNKSPHDTKADQPYVLVVGGLTTRKGGDRVLATARVLNSRKDPIEIRVVGRSEPDFEKQAELLPNLRHLGYRGVDSGLPQLMRSAVAVYFPSRYETFGIPAVEAMAAGTPAVVSDEAALPEVTGDAGVIIRPDDPEETADTLRRLHEDSTFRSERVARGRNRAQRYTWLACTQRLTDLLGSHQLS